MEFAIPTLVKLLEHKDERYRLSIAQLYGMLSEQGEW
jgi:hypothetical protein